MSGATSAPGQQEEEVLGKPYDARLMRRILRYLRPYRPSVVFALVCIGLFSVLTSLGPFYSKQAIDRYLGGAAQSHGLAAHGIVDRWLDGFLSSDPMRGVGQLALLYMLTLLAEFVVEYAQTYAMQITGQKLMFDLRMEIFSHLQRLQLSYFDRNPVGRLVTRVTTDVNVLNETFTQGVVTIFGDVLTLAFIVLVMVRMNARLALVAFAVMPAIMLVTRWFRKNVRESFRRIRLAVARINSYLQEHVTGMTVLQLFNREERSLEEFSAINRAHMEAFKDAIFAHAVFYPLVEILSAVAIALILWYGGLRALAGATTFGVVVAFIQYAQRFYRPIMDLSEKYNVLQEAMASAERIFTLLDTPVEITSPAQPVAFPATEESPDAMPRGRIEFRNVWFAYKPAEAPAPDAEPEWVLRDVSFTVDPGQTIAIVGHTGAGKTTVISLLLRFYDVSRGEILLDGVDIRQMDLAVLRRNFGVVLQDPFLFTGTLETNIRLGSTHVTQQAMEDATEEVNVADFVRSLPEGFATQVRERGATLSVGQKQLISFARALAHRPRILILDEATSSVDTATEHRVRAALENMVEGRTSLMIAHRLSTIQRADRILVFHKGKLRETGDHQTLLAHKGIYWKLYQLQFQ
jgi:ATP-binding cassette, subfamily B, multidrug efflux pump